MKRTRWEKEVMVTLIRIGGHLIVARRGKLDVVDRETGERLPTKEGIVYLQLLGEDHETAYRGRKSSGLPVLAAPDKNGVYAWE